MGLFSKPFIDVVEWHPQGNEIVYAYHFPERNLSTATQLVVHESQVALLFSKGQLMGTFGPGEKLNFDTPKFCFFEHFY